MEVSRFNEKKLRCLFEGTLYSEVIIMKSFYWFSKDYDVTLSKESDVFEIVLSKKEGVIDDKLLSYLNSKIKQDVYDFKLRQIIYEETKTVKELLIAKAFANSDEYDTPPNGEFSDPVGYNPEK